MVNTKIRFIIFFAAKDGETLYSQQKQDWELTVAQIMNSFCQIQTEIEESRKTTRPFRYDLNQIPYDYTLKVTNRFKGLDLIECLKNYGWRYVTLYRRQGLRSSLRKRNEKWLSEESLQFALKGRKVKGKEEKECYTHLNAELQRIARRYNKAFLRDQCKEIDKNNKMGKTRDLLKKIRDTKGTFHSKMGTIKDRHNKGQT